MKIDQKHKKSRIFSDFGQKFTGPKIKVAQSVEKSSLACPGPPNKTQLLFYDVWGLRKRGQKFLNFSRKKAYTLPVCPTYTIYDSHLVHPKLPGTFGCVTRRKMVKIEKIQKNLKSPENFQNFRGGFVQIRLQATEHEFLENKANLYILFVLSI